MLVSVDIDKCTACGTCVYECPEVFDQDDEGMVVLLNSNPPVELAEATQDAVDACPSAVITVSVP